MSFDQIWDAYQDDRPLSSKEREERELALERLYARMDRRDDRKKLVAVSVKEIQGLTEEDDIPAALGRLQQKVACLQHRQQIASQIAGQEKLIAAAMKQMRELDDIPAAIERLQRAVADTISIVQRQEPVDRPPS